MPAAGVFSCVEGDEACRGTVLTDSDSDANSSSSSSDNDDDDDGDGAAVLDKVVARRRRRQTLKHRTLGTVRVLWSDAESGPRRHRLGRDGRVDVWCVDSAPGGQFYPDHLAVLDRELLPSHDDSADDSENDDGDVDGSDSSDTACSFRIAPSLGKSTRVQLTDGARSIEGPEGTPLVLWQAP